ncbi:MAG TPA: histidinol dehydrogenase [Candidatus Limnocylindrales bacterium]|nr:histidinol dehydrogenase [Candidatus Limnocylindrales bacterium]
MSRIRRVDWSALDEPARSAWAAGLRPDEPAADVDAILAGVRSRGDEALRALTARYDGADLPDPWLDVDPEPDVPAELLDALERAASAIRRYHADQRDALRPERRVRTAPGVTAWRRWQPLERIGAYVPGGRAAYPSSVLMLGIPAALAGVEEVVLATPPNPDGSVSPAVLAAARIAGIGRVLRAGGAQAVAAMAYGTASVPRVDKIFGAGNAWVTAAKRAVSSRVAIDLPAGPSECVVVADEGADPELVALDLLAQAEHGPDSVAIVVSTSGAFLDEVERRLGDCAAGLDTGDRALGTVAAHGAAVLVADLDAAVEVTNAVAAEHVSLQCAGADAVAAQVRQAGAVFIGPWSAIAAGDYATGTNHVLPTGGAARAWGGVGVEAFGRWIELQRLSPTGVRSVAPTVDTIARAEGLPAHAASVVARAVRAEAAAVVPDDAAELLRRPEPVAAYPAEPSDEELAERAGIPVETVVRADMNTMGGTPWRGLSESLAAVPPRAVVEYGDLAYARLRSALAEPLGVAADRIVPGAGADELIRLVTTQALGAGDAVIVPTPTFAMFAVEARLAGARVVEVPRADPARRQPAHELRDAAERHAARLVWLCTPNNPTGDAYDLAEIRDLADGLPALLCVDEVYAEFGEEATGARPGSTSAVRLQDEGDNVVVLRSLSKAYGMAGARVGYLVVPDALVDRFQAARLPLSIASPSEAVALAALAESNALRDRRRALAEARDRLSATLAGLGCRVLPSVTNFVTFRPPDDGPDAAGADAALLRRGVALRRYDSGPIAGWLRATARLDAEEERLLAALGEVLG